jgi:hypothetical protein
VSRLQRLTGEGAQDFGADRDENIQMNGAASAMTVSVMGMTAMPTLASIQLADARFDGSGAGDT